MKKYKVKSLSPRVTSTLLHLALHGEFIYHLYRLKRESEINFGYLLNIFKYFGIKYLSKFFFRYKDLHGRDREGICQLLTQQ